MDKYTLPQTLEAPVRIVLLTLNELMAFLVPFLLLTFVFNSLIIGVGLGVVLVYSLKKFKGEQGQHYLLNLMYWYLPPIVRFQAIPPSHQRRYVG